VKTVTDTNNKKKYINITSKFNKYFGSKSSIVVAINLCSILENNICDFYDVKHTKLYLTHM